jgi:hypothetical protein
MSNTKTKVIEWYKEGHYAIKRFLNFVSLGRIK